MSIAGLLGKIATYILNPLIILGFVIATIYLFIGIIQLIWRADSGDLEQNKRNITYGIIGLFVMFSVYGILNVVIDTFNIDCTGIFFC